MDLERDLLGAVRGPLGVYRVSDIHMKDTAIVSTMSDPIRTQRFCQPSSGSGARVLQSQFAPKRARKMSPQFRKLSARQSASHPWLSMESGPRPSLRIQAKGAMEIQQRRAACSRSSKAAEAISRSLTERS
jgi:hypothetical protein